MIRNLRPATSRALLCSTAIAVLLSACGTSKSGNSEEAANSTSRISAVVSFYPLEEAARALAGDRMDIKNLTPVGGGPHDLELQPADLERLEKADVVFYLGRNFQPSLEKAVGQLPASVKRVDLLTTVDLLPVDAPVEGVVGEVDGEVLEGDIDPHVWVDPTRFAAMVKTMAETLQELSPQDASDIEENAKTYVAGLDKLDGEFAKGLEQCESTAVVTSHRAFGYMTQRYGLKQLPISGISPEDEPDAKSLEAVAAAAKREKVTVIFFETLVPKKLSETVAREIGAGTDALNPIEGLTSEELDAGETYASIQRKNLASLRAGLRCS